MTNKDLILLWCVAYLVAFVAFVARVAYVLFNPLVEVPSDPAELERWKRRRRWLLMSEFCALPLFATSAVLISAKGWADPVLSVIYALVCGVLGIAFFIRTTRALVVRRLGTEDLSGGKDGTL